MPINFTCPHCSTQTNVPDEYAGQTGPCAQCGNMITIPGQASAAPLGSEQPDQGHPVPEQPQQPHPSQAESNPYANPVGQPGLQPPHMHPGQPPYMHPNQPQYMHPGQATSNDPAMRMLIPVDRSALAIIAGYLGLFSLLCFPAPIAIIVGILAVRDVQKNPAKHGLGRAWFGIIMGAIFTLIPIVIIVIGIISDM